MTNAWNDFNDARQNANLIPKGTIARVRLTIRPGGFDDPSQGWTGGYAKRGQTGAVYIDAEYTVLEGKYARRKVWSMIGLYSPKGPDWGNMGRSFVRGILNSARGLSDKDNSPEAQNARRISGIADLDGIEFVARIDLGTDANGDEKNDIRQAVTRDHKDYAAAMGSLAAPMGFAPAPAYASHQSAYAAAAQQPAYAAPAQQSSYAPPQHQQPTHAPHAPQQPAHAPQQAAPAPVAGARPTWAQ
ncbi:hypothetical protein [Aquibium sp. ELW1220]|uniref:hypothetical protein n=1 Tax=Aquibium sp. ELW1220 TaxID=2976766 RepID=UPI0025B17E1A|nr:hypothetical protein [Aquibium sp. ELW1220]MDN2584158.1 hypothetical protein [Aquibium sp. ELW1220]